MARLRVPLTDVPSEVRCAKPGCSVASHTRLQRHHKRHPAMWLGIWASRRRGEKRWEEFIARYYKFLPEDVVLICDSHHAEIHSLYDKLITKDRAHTQIAFSKYSWVQAVCLMNKLEQLCNEWLKRESPGISSSSYSETRKVYKSVLRRSVKKLA